MSRPAGFDAPRYGIAALIACAYVGASAWVIRGQGESYRGHLRERRPALARDLAPPRPVEDADPPAKDVPPPEARRVDTAAPPPTSAPPAAPPLSPEGPRPTTPPAVAVGPAKPEPVIDPFWELPDQKTVWDLDHFTIDDERWLGAALHQMVLHTHKPVDEGPLPQRVEQTAEPLLKPLAKAGLKYTLTVLDCDEPNAFSHPGGYVYVCKGIFDVIGEDEDYALAFVLAHEIAHVDLGHALEILRDPGVRSLPASTVAKFYWPILPCGYKEDQDFEADRWAWKRMSQAGSSRREVLAFLRKLEDYARKNGFENRRKLPMEDPTISPLDHHVRSHPIPRARLKSLVEAMDPPPKKPG